MLEQDLTNLIHEARRKKQMKAKDGIDFFIIIFFFVDKRSVVSLTRIVVLDTWRPGRAVLLVGRHLVEMIYLRLARIKVVY
jgi:hypothetical protein